MADEALLGGRRQEAGGSLDENLTTMHENPSLRVSASPRLSVYFQIRREEIGACFFPSQFL
ncbi:MAG: hypothetical protein F6J96_13080 [Symploca sp. SIO1C2]|nr:hypothetical protein [Symploca sp. SIO1C2]